MGALGFDFERGRLDVSLHPFCGGVPDDIRITTRYTEDDFTQSLMGEALTVDLPEVHQISQFIDTVKRPITLNVL